MDILKLSNAIEEELWYDIAFSKWKQWNLEEKVFCPYDIIHIISGVWEKLINAEFVL
jgi:hypothetical protein